MVPAVAFSRPSGAQRSSSTACGSRNLLVKPLIITGQKDLLVPEDLLPPESLTHLILAVP